MAQPFVTAFPQFSLDVLPGPNLRRLQPRTFGTEVSQSDTMLCFLKTMAQPGQNVGKIHAKAHADGEASPATSAFKSASDESMMEEALRCAHRALQAGEVPVGAIVVEAGKIVGMGWNRNIADNDPTAHAEIVALREAGRNIGNHRLNGCDLFVTIEPCPMCAGAAIHARLRRLVYGADDLKAGAVRSILPVINHSRLNHRMEVKSGVLAGRSADMLQEFFRKRREINREATNSDRD